MVNAKSFASLDGNALRDIYLDLVYYSTLYIGAVSIASTTL